MLYRVHAAAKLRAAAEMLGALRTASTRSKRIQRSPTGTPVVASPAGPVIRFRTQLGAELQRTPPEFSTGRPKFSA
jgi:hypothetical protein